MKVKRDAHDLAERNSKGKRFEVGYGTDYRYVISPTGIIVKALRESRPDLYSRATKARRRPEKVHKAFTGLLMTNKLMQRIGIDFLP